VREEILHRADELRAELDKASGALSELSRDAYLANEETLRTFIVPRLFEAFTSLERLASACEHLYLAEQVRAAEAHAERLRSEFTQRYGGGPRSG
jgi:hypothetical protein